MKNKIRKLNKITRREMSLYEVRKKSCMAADVFINSDIYKKSAVIMLYMPIGNETDTTAIKDRALKDGKKVVYPVTDLKSGQITPYYVKANTEFVLGAFSVFEPQNEEIADIDIIDTVVVPGIGFDKNGARVGFGKGCYDRFLNMISAIKVGYCYDFQLCDKIFADAHDINMDYIITENGLIDCFRRNE